MQLPPPFDRSQWHWRFAWLPTKLYDGSIVWFEKYRARYVDVGHLWAEFTWQRVATMGEEW